MYLTDIITKKGKEARVESILSQVLKIKSAEKDIKQANDEKETIKFLSEQMLKELKKVLK